MTTKLDRNGWIAVVLIALSSLLNMLLTRLAGMPSPDTMAQWLVYALCFAGIRTCLGFLAWSVVLLVAPRSKLLDPLSR